MAASLGGSYSAVEVFQNFLSRSAAYVTFFVLKISLSRVFVSFEDFCLTLIKKDRQNGEHGKGRVLYHQPALKNFLQQLKLIETNNNMLQILPMKTSNNYLKSNLPF